MNINNVAEFAPAQELIRQFKGDTYVNGVGVLEQAGALAASLGRRALFVRDAFPGCEPYTETICASLNAAGVEIVAVVDGAAPNAPREDLQRIAAEVTAARPEVVVSFGGGSTIDAVKAAIVLDVLGGGIEEYFGTGLVSAALEKTGKTLIPHLAIQTASSSSAHLTKYSNITDRSTNQKKLIVDEAVVPQRALFDYAVTTGSPLSLTADGALDGISHALEVLYSAAGKPAYGKVEPVALEAIRLVVAHLPAALQQPSDTTARTALGLATDLGGYAIMIGGTNGAHLTSFSLVDVLSHGRACGMLNPYYTVFFAPAVTDALRKVAAIYREHGYMAEDPAQLSGRELGLAAAQAMIAFEKQIGFPTTLQEVPGFTDQHIEQALSAAKNPQLKMKLENMPVPMTAEMVDEYMRPILLAAKTGQLEGIKNVGS
jgi:alcohol dehydrogenase class IV